MWEAPFSRLLVSEYKQQFIKIAAKYLFYFTCLNFSRLCVLVITVTFIIVVAACLILSYKPLYLWEVQKPIEIPSIKNSLVHHSCIACRPRKRECLQLGEKL